MTIALEAHNIYTQFGDNIIHAGLSLEIQKGEIFGIVGGSGTGKSLLLNDLIGLTKPRRGTITYHPPFSCETIGVLFQQGGLLSSLTVLENIMFPLQRVLWLEEKLARELAFLKLQTVGLDPRDAHKYPFELSGGMIKRVGIARALAMEPNILFLDEPTAGLDPISADEFDDLILLLKKDFGLTMVMVTHDLDTLVKTCDRVGVLVDKQLVIDTIAGICTHGHPWIKAYFQGFRGWNRFTSQNIQSVESKEKDDGNKN